jgi:hypothetical protein
MLKTLKNQLMSRKALAFHTMGEKYFKIPMSIPEWMIIVSLWFSVIFLSCNYGDKSKSLVDDLKNGLVKVSDIESIRIFNDSGRGIDYNVLVSNKSEIQKLILLLRDNSTEGHGAKNHPSWLMEGTIKIELTDNRLYFIYFDILTYKGIIYMSFISLPEGQDKSFRQWNYENQVLGKYLEDLIQKRNT